MRFAKTPNNELNISRKIEDKLNQLSIKNEGKDQEKFGGKEEKIRQLLQELIESEMRYVEDLNEVV